MAALGFAAQDGGRHPGRGTANLVVPLGDQYIELVCVADHEQARSSPQGRPVVAALARRGPGLARWSVEASDIETASARVGLPVERRQRLRPDGETVRWRAVGVDLSWDEPWRCAFMAWDDQSLHPARAPAPHPNGATGFTLIEVTVPSLDATAAWLGGAAPGSVRLVVGPDTGPRRLVVSTPSGPLEPLG